MSEIQRRLDARRAQLDRIAESRKQSGLTIEGRPFRLRFNGLTGKWAYSLTLASGVQVSGIDFESDEAARTAARELLQDITRNQVLMPTLDMLEQHARELRQRPPAELAAPKPRPVVRLYTDGSNIGQPGPAGWGALLVFEDGREQELSGPMVSATNNQAELMGVIEGLKALETPHIVKLTSDSQYVVQGLNTWLAGWVKRGWRGQSGDVKNRDLWEQLLALKQRHTIAATWVRGHNGHPENERVDKLAGLQSRAEKARQEAEGITPDPAAAAQELKPAEKPRLKPIPAAAPPASGKKLKRRCSRCEKWHEQIKRSGRGHETRRYCLSCYDLEMAERRALTQEQKELGCTR